MGGICGDRHGGGGGIWGDWQGVMERLGTGKVVVERYKELDWQGLVVEPHDTRPGEAHVCAPLEVDVV